MSLREAIKRAVEGRHLDAPTLEAAMETVLAGEASDSQIAALAVALRMKGETAAEIAAAARVLRRRCVPVNVKVEGPLVDTAGTGGDGLGTFNISTTAAIVIAACGVPVAKHGNRGVSSPTGSADMLEALGVRIDLGPEQVAASIEDVGIGFMFAPLFHAALGHAAPVRRALGIRTLFNVLGPLANPAPVTHQLLGVFDRARVRQVAEVLGMLGMTGAWVVHGEGGFDEVSPCGPTHVAVLERGRVFERTVRPEDFGLEPVPVEGLIGGDGAVNAGIARAVLSGDKGAPRTAVIINAAATLCAAGVEGDPVEAAKRAAAAIDDGRAADVLARWIAVGR